MRYAGWRRGSGCSPPPPCSSGWVETGAAVEFAQDKSNREIARSMVVSESTVKSHLSHLYRKLGVSSRREAVRQGLERGLLT